MPTRTYLTLDKDVQQVSQSTIDAFAAQVSGGVLGPADTAFEEARRV